MELIRALVALGQCDDCVSRVGAAAAAAADGGKTIEAPNRQTAIAVAVALPDEGAMAAIFGGSVCLICKQTQKWKMEERMVSSREIRYR